jgi:hypothetical protein
VKRVITIVMPPRPDQLAQLYAWAAMSDVCHPRAMHAPCRDMMRMPGHWDHETRDL